MTSSNPSANNASGSTFDQLRDILTSQHHLDVSHLTRASTLTDAGLDSLATAELLFSIEDTFKINLGDLPPEEIPSTFGELIDLIDSHLAKAK